MTSPFRPANQPGPFNTIATHPTVPFGQPGAPAAVVLPPNAPLPTWNEQANGQAGNQTASAAPQFYNREGQPVDQQGRVINQAPPTPQGTFPSNGSIFQQQSPAENQQLPKNYLPDEYVFDGDNVPQELRGRTWRQVRGVYGALASDFISRPGAAPAPAPNMPAAPPVAAAPQETVPEQDRVTNFWRDPLGAIERVVDSRLAPIQQQTAVQAAEEARRFAASQVPDWSSVEAEVIEIARSVPQEQLGAALQNPGWWTNAADLARGRLMNRGQYQRPNSPIPQANNMPYNQAPQGARSIPAAHEFFTEAPTAPNGNTFYSGGQANAWELTSDQKMYAQKMNMTDQEYRDWSGGVQRPQNARRW